MAGHRGRTENGTFLESWARRKVILEEPELPKKRAPTQRTKARDSILGNLRVNESNSPEKESGGKKG